MILTNNRPEITLVVHKKVEFKTGNYTDESLKDFPGNRKLKSQYVPYRRRTDRKKRTVLCANKTLGPGR